MIHEVRLGGETAKGCMRGRTAVGSARTGRSEPFKYVRRLWVTLLEMEEAGFIVRTSSENQHRGHLHYVDCDPVIRRWRRGVQVNS
jgi:hypothetical protein